MLVGREIWVVGTANIGKQHSGYTLLESTRGSEDMAALTIAYYQVPSCSQHLDEIYTWQTQYSLPYAPLSEHPEPWS